MVWIPVGLLSQGVELVGGDFLRQRLPSVPIPEQNQEVGPRGNLLGAAKFVEADPHGAMVESCLGRHAPAKVDRLELKAADRQYRSNSGQTRSCRAFRSWTKSLKVELTKTRMTGRNRCFIGRASLGAQLHRGDNDTTVLLDFGLQ